MYKDMIRIDSEMIAGAEVNAVNAREIHKFLGVKTKFSMWIQRAIEKYDFIEDEDFLLSQKRESGNNAIIKDYIVTIDMAKELAMLENNPKGKEVRKYFIKTENKYKSTSQDKTIESKYIKLLEKYIKIIEQNDNKSPVFTSDLEMPKLATIIDDYFILSEKYGFLIYSEDLAKRLGVSKGNLTTIKTKHKDLFINHTHTVHVGKNQYADYGINPLKFSNKIKFYTAEGAWLVCSFIDNKFSRALKDYIKNKAYLRGSI